MKPLFVTEQHLWAYGLPLPLPSSLDWLQYCTCIEYIYVYSVCTVIEDCDCFSLKLVYRELPTSIYSYSNPTNSLHGQYLTWCSRLVDTECAHGVVRVYTSVHIVAGERRLSDGIVGGAKMGPTAILAELEWPLGAEGGRSPSESSCKKVDC